MRLLIRKHRELISVVVPEYGDGPPRFGSSTRVGQRPRGWSDAVSKTLHPETPSSPLFRYVAELGPTVPGNDQGSFPVGEPRRTPGWPWTALWSVPSLGSHLTACALTPVGSATRTHPDDPAASFVCEVPLDGSTGLTQAPRGRDRALRRVQTQAQIKTRYPSPAEFTAFPPPRLAVRRRPRRRRLVD
jgi:hypothetical protein